MGHWGCRHRRTRSRRGRAEGEKRSAQHRKSLEMRTGGPSILSRVRGITACVAQVGLAARLSPPRGPDRAHSRSGRGKGHLAQPAELPQAHQWRRRAHRHDRHRPAHRPLRAGQGRQHPGRLAGRPEQAQRVAALGRPPHLDRAGRQGAQLRPRQRPHRPHAGRPARREADAAGRADDERAEGAGRHARRARLRRHYRAPAHQPRHRSDRTRHVGPDDHERQRHGDPAAGAVQAARGRVPAGPAARAVALHRPVRSALAARAALPAPHRRRVEDHAAEGRHHEQGRLGRLRPPGPAVREADSLRREGRPTPTTARTPRSTRKRASSRSRAWAAREARAGTDRDSHGALVPVLRASRSRRTTPSSSRRSRRSSPRRTRPRGPRGLRSRRAHSASR